MAVFSAESAEMAENAKKHQKFIFPINLTNRNGRYRNTKTIKRKIAVTCLLTSMTHPLLIHPVAA